MGKGRSGLNTKSRIIKFIIAGYLWRAKADKELYFTA